MNFRHSGFSAIELLVTLAIVAIVAVVAAPSFSSMLLSTRTTSISNQLFGDLNLARSEAIKRNSRVLMCIANTGRTACATTGSDWSGGWLLCTADTANSNLCATAAAGNPNPFVKRSNIPNGLTLVGGTTNATSNIIKFNPNGSAVAGELVLTGDKKRCLYIANTGNITINLATSLSAPC